MVVTPKSVMEVDDWIMLLNGGERVAAITAAYMMYNFFCSVLEERDKALREWISKEKTKAKAIAEDSMNLPLYKRNMGMATHDKLTALEVYLDTGNPDAKVELSWKESNEG